MKNTTDQLHENNASSSIGEREINLSNNISESQQGGGSVIINNPEPSFILPIDHSSNGILKTKKITFTFILFFSIITLAYIQCLFSSFDINDYCLSIWPILYKKQYYRIITNQFYHTGLFHYLMNVIALFLITQKIENQIGTIYTLIISFHSILLISLMYIAWMYCLKKLFSIAIFNFNFSFQCGFSSNLFSLYTLYFLLDINKSKTVNLLFITVKGQKSSFIWLILLQFITINYSFIANLSGILIAYCYINILTYVSFPKSHWISDFESLCCCNKCNKWLFYIPLTTERKNNSKQLSKLCDFKIINCLRKIFIAVFYNSSSDNDNHKNIIINNEVMLGNSNPELNNNSNNSEDVHPQGNQSDIELPSIDSQIAS